MHSIIDGPVKLSKLTGGVAAGDRDAKKRVKAATSLTRGLGNVPNLTSGNLTQQQTTNQDAPEVGADGGWFVLS